MYIPRRALYSVILTPFDLGQWNFQRGRFLVRTSLERRSAPSFVIRAFHHRRRRRKCAARSSTRDSRSTEDEDTRGWEVRRRWKGCPRENAWVDGFWHGESVSVQLEDRKTSCILSLPLPLSFSSSPLVLSLCLTTSPFLPSSAIPPLSLIRSFSLTQRDYCRGHPGGQSVRRQPPRRRDALLSLFLSYLSICFSFSLSRFSRRHPQHREATTTRSVDHPIGRDTVVNFPTTRTNDTIDADFDRRVRRKQAVS